MLSEILLRIPPAISTTVPPRDYSQNYLRYFFNIFFIDFPGFDSRFPLRTPIARDSTLGTHSFIYSFHDWYRDFFSGNLTENPPEFLEIFSRIAIGILF